MGGGGGGVMFISVGDSVRAVHMSTVPGTYYSDILCICGG